MSLWKVTYFPFMALAEPIRFLLSFMGKKFQDYRFDPKIWPQIKHEMPFGKVPTLEMDGQVLHQSAAICRYLGSQASIAGSTPWQQLQIDIAVDTFTDFRMNISKYVHEEDPDRKEKLRETIITEIYPYYMERFDTIIQDNGGFVANSSLSWGDLYIVSLLDMVRGILKDERITTVTQAAKYPNITALEKHIKELPSIKKWIETRPVTEF